MIASKEQKRPDMWSVVECFTVSNPTAVSYCYTKNSFISIYIYINSVDIQKITNLTGSLKSIYK